jgi:hypothetical protein
MPQVFRLKDSPGGFLTRRQGEEVRAYLVNLNRDLPPGERLVIDFAGVEVMTPSFADECFGKLAESIGGLNFRERVKLTGADPIIRTLLNSVLAERLNGSNSRASA